LMFGLPRMRLLIVTADARKVDLYRDSSIHNIGIGQIVRLIRHQGIFQQ
jgi:hypothetical protein